jgi:parallel beta-helix repeat protein
MKKLTLLILLIGSVLFANAQYTSPGTFKKLNMDSLVALSGGAVVDSGSYYRIQQNIKIAATDTLQILSNKTIRLDTTVLLSVRGTLIIDPQDSVLFTCMFPGKNYMGITLDTSSASVFRNAMFEYGGGIRLSSSSILIEYCKIRNNKRLNPNANNATNVINLFRSSPVIRNCVIENNAGSAVGGGANIANAPKILTNYIYGNNTNNDNRPQINIGTTGTDTMIIKGNKIIGNRTKILVGGVAVSSVIGSVFAVIDSNEIDDNRYGITVQGGNNRTVISNNKIRNNNTQNNPAQGGSGLNFIGTNTQISMVSGNYIAGNLWGATIQTSATPNFGEAGVNTGGNIFVGNGNGGQTYALFNNTAQNIKAENNQWDNAVTFAGVESVISHHNDDALLGTVDYRPFIGQQITDYVSPSDTISLTLDDIVNDTSGAVEEYPDYYQIRANITISATDTLDIVNNKEVIRVDSALLIEVLGTIRMTGHMGRLIVTATDTTKHFKGIDIYNSDKSSIRGVIVQHSGGIRLIESDVEISDCIFRKNGITNSGAVIYLSGSSPLITTSQFLDNEGMAISSVPNIASAPTIMDNMMINNNTADETTYYQISLGASGADTTRILVNHIEGNEAAGGIFITPIALPANVIIENNTVSSNAYGIIVSGFDVYSRVKNNIISNNISGSGLQFSGDTGNIAMVSGNLISNNSIGAVVMGSARPNFGETGVNQGGNIFMFNGSVTDTLAFYNISDQDIKAENNTWLNFTTLAQVESVVLHKNDDNDLGFVDFDPFVGQIVTGIPHEEISSVKIYPQPADKILMIDTDVEFAEVFDINGSLLKRIENTNRVEVSDLANGIYLLKVNGTKMAKIIVSR